MKKAINSLLVVIAVVICFACNSLKDKDILVGKWERVGTDSLSLVIEFNDDNAWLYFKNGELVEDGTYLLQNKKLILKHTVDERDHDHDHSHDHKHPEDHIYDYSFSKDSTELILGMGDKTSTYKKR